MKKNYILILCITLIFIRQTAFGTDKGQKLCLPTGNINIKAPEGVNAKRASIDFPHPKHFSYSCKKCHHTWNGMEEIKSCAISGCHNLIKSPDKPIKNLTYTKDGIKYFKYAYHKQCIGCHTDIKNKNIEKEKKLSAKNLNIQPTGPINCNQCHPK